MTLARYLLRHPFVRFAMVGGAGYVVNVGVLALDTDILGLHFDAGIAFSILISMCFTWLGNRYLTFREHRARSLRGAFEEWLKFMGTNLIGAAFNYGTSVLLVHYASQPLGNKYVAQAAGVLVGLIFNFTLSKKLVFKAPVSH